MRCPRMAGKGGKPRFVGLCLWKEGQLRPVWRRHNSGGDKRTFHLHVSPLGAACRLTTFSWPTPGTNNTRPSHYWPLANTRGDNKDVTTTDIRVADPDRHKEEKWQIPANPEAQTAFHSILRTKKQGHHPAFMIPSSCCHPAVIVYIWWLLTSR